MTVFSDFTRREPSRDDSSPRCVDVGGGLAIVTVADHLRIAEENKRNSPAWKDFVPQDGMACEFVPFAIGWYGEMGREVKSFVRRVADHHIGDAYAKEWRIRRILAQVQVKHLNLIGVYLKTVRGEYERVGAAKKSNRRLPTLEWFVSQIPMVCCH